MNRFKVNRIDSNVSHTTVDVAQLNFLLSPAGERALAVTAQMPPDRLTRLQRLRRTVSAEQAVGVVELLELRQRARVKFAYADRMFFTPEGLEQSTSEVVAAYRAQRFPVETPILDACGGIGGDALALRQRGPVLVAENNPAVLACARANAQAIPADHPHAVFPLCADVTTLDLPRLQQHGFASAFFDPSRRVDTSRGRSRTRDAEAYLPPLSWLETLTATFENVGVKLAPGEEDAVLTRSKARVEFISYRGECKEAVLWFGGCAASLPDPDAHTQDGEPYCATVLTCSPAAAEDIASDSSPSLRVAGEAIDRHTLTPFLCDLPLLSEPRAWLYEPDPAVIRAHLVPHIAARLNAALLEPQIAYLTGDALLSTPFARAYRILDWMPFHWKNLQTWLRVHHRRVEVVKRRGVALEPEEVRKKLSSPALADAPSLVLALTRRSDKTIALLCDPPA